MFWGARATEKTAQRRANQERREALYLELVEAVHETQWPSVAELYFRLALFGSAKVRTIVEEFIHAAGEARQAERYGMEGEEREARFQGMHHAKRKLVEQASRELQGKAG